MKNAMNIVKGVGAGLATGMLVGYMGSKAMSKNPRQMKRKANKTMQAVGEIVNGVSYMFK